MKNLKECPICLNKDIKLLLKQKDKNLGIPGEFSLYECSNCRGIFLNPQPSAKESEKFYPKREYYSLDKIKTNDNSMKTRIKLKLFRIYFSEGKNIIDNIFFSPIKFIARGTLVKKGIKLLDIGSGSGQFLYEMKQFGMDVYGIEPGKFDEEGDKKYNLNIKKGDLKSAKYKKEYFDLITINHVLEHLINPNETLLEIKKILKKNGTLIIGVPNTNSLAKIIYGKNWYQFDIPRHVINYSEKNLSFILNKNGFKVKNIRYNSRPSQFSVSLMYLLNIKSRTMEKLFNIIFLPLTWIVNSLKTGDQIEVLCEKK
jgi:2-polyprenyl-3-methyl-5-hydroxy-6-metoxy-1,4-benzoquinol methylase